MDSPIVWIIVVMIGILLTGLGFFYWHTSRKHQRFDFKLATAAFEHQRSHLQEVFFRSAAASGKPRGLRWVECQWNDLIAWVIEKETGQLLALAGVTIAFEAIEGSDMEGLEAVGNLRNATAVFVYQDGQWSTLGRVLFNLNPDEAVERYKGAYERVNQ